MDPSCLSIAILASRVRETKTYKHTIQTNKVTKTDTGTIKHPPIHKGTKSERDKKTHKNAYIQTDMQTDKDRHWDKQTLANTHTGKESERDKNAHRH